MKDLLELEQLLGRSYVSTTGFNQYQGSDQLDVTHIQPDTVVTGLTQGNHVLSPRDYTQLGIALDFPVNVENKLLSFGLTRQQVDMLDELGDDLAKGRKNPVEVLSAIGVIDNVTQYAVISYLVEIGLIPSSLNLA